MKNFDEEREQLKDKRDLEFVIGGERFHVRPFIAPETMDAFTANTGKDAKEGERAKTLLEVYDGWVEAVLVEGEAKKWAKVRKEANPPLSLHDIEEVVFWLVEVAAGRPTERSSSSGAGRRPPTATSKEASRSQVHAA